MQTLTAEEMLKIYSLNNALSQITSRAPHFEIFRDQIRNGTLTPTDIGDNDKLINEHKKNLQTMLDGATNKEKLEHLKQLKRRKGQRKSPW